MLCERVFLRDNKCSSLDLSRSCPAAACQPTSLAAAVLGPCRCVSAGSTALRACVPSPLVLCPDSSRPALQPPFAG